MIPGSEKRNVQCKMTNDNCKMSLQPVWTSKLSQSKLRKLYTRLRLNAIDEEMILDVGWHLYLRARDIQIVRRARVVGCVPCPQCGDEVQRTKVDVREAANESRYPIGWFHCPDCETRLLWRDCRDALKTSPVCFRCGETLDRADDGSLRCGCGKTWAWQAYKASVAARINLPCPRCWRTLHKPSLVPKVSRPKGRSEQSLTCPKCGESAKHEGGDIRCASCGFSRRWRAYRRSLKRRDEQLTCGRCHRVFIGRRGSGLHSNIRLARETTRRWRRSWIAGRKRLEPTSRCRGSICLFKPYTEEVPSDRFSSKVRREASGGCWMNSRNYADVNSTMPASPSIVIRWPS